MKKNTIPPPINILVSVLLIFISTAVLTGQFTQSEEPQHKPLQYRMDVKATLVPFFVMDKKGNPVFDLKEEDFQLFVDDKPVAIQALMGYRFETEEKQQKTLEKTQSPVQQNLYREPRRVVFIVLDSMNNTFYGIDKAKRIAVQMVQKSDPSDSFVILEVTLQQGLKYHAGPEPNSPELIKKIKKLKLTPGKSIANDFLTDHAAEIAANQFVYSISQLKYALKTITKPKILYLISEGIKQSSLQEDYGHKSSMASRVNYFFGDLLKAINYGGCVLHVIYPGRRTNLSDVTFTWRIPLGFIPGIKTSKLAQNTDWMLKYIAIGSGGAFFNNPDIKDLVTSVKRTSTAYYELVFSDNNPEKQRHRVVVKSKRNDLIVHTLNFTEAEKDYKQMALTQKKVFAINVATEGSWSRMVGKVVKNNFKKLKKEKRKNGTYLKIQVPIPDELKNKKAEIFLLRFDKSYQQSDIGYSTRTLSDTEEFELEAKKKKKLLYYVIIDPESTFTIYNRVK